MKQTKEQKVIIKFLKWYESLTPEERMIFEYQLGAIIKGLK